MLVRINLLWAHGNEEKEAKEVEQEQLESEQRLRKKTKIIGFSHRKWLVVPHDDANHEHDGDEEVASTCHHPKDKVVFRSLVIDIGWISINIRVNTTPSRWAVWIQKVVKLIFLVRCCRCRRRCCCCCCCCCSGCWKWWDGWRWVGDSHEPCSWKNGREVFACQAKKYRNYGILLVIHPNF